MKKPISYMTVLGAIVLAMSVNTAHAAKEAYFVKVDRDTTTQNSAQNDPRKKQPANKEKPDSLPTGKRQHKPLVVTKEMDKSSTQGTKKNVNSGQKPKTTGLLLPAVQKVRAAASEPKAKKKGNVETEFKVEKGEK